MWLIELEEKEEVHEANFRFHIFYILPLHFKVDLNDGYADITYDTVFSVLKLV